jgi:hypothetical protein
MKVAVSIPDDVFAEAELLAKQLNTTRSDLYSRALGEFIGRRAPGHVTQLMNDALDAVGYEQDDFPGAASRQVLSQIEW